MHSTHINQFRLPVTDRATTYPSQSDSPTAYNSLNGQHEREVEIDPVSKKRPRDDQLENSQFHQPTQTMQEGEMAAQITQPESYSSSVDLEGQEPIPFIFKHSPIKLEIMPYDDKWAPFFAWTKRYFFRKNSELQSEIIKSFLKRFDKEEMTLNELLPNRKYYQKVTFRDLSLELICVNHNPDREDLHDFIILPKGIRGVKARRSKCLSNIKIRITKILEASELFIGLASLQELDREIFGIHWENTRQTFMGWIEEMFFEETDDSLPIFGRYRGTWPEAEQAGNRFGSAQKVLATVLAQLKQPRHDEIYRVSLSLLGYWYSITALKLGRSDLKGHPENLWIFAESANSWNNDLSRLMKAGTGSSERQNRQQDTVVSHHNINNQEEVDFFRAKMNEHFGNSRDIQHKESLFNVVGLHQKKGKSMITQESRYHIRAEIEKSVLAIQGNFLRLDEQTKLKDLPIYLVPAYRDDQTHDQQHVLITLSDGRGGQRSRVDQNTLFENRIIRILESLSILHQIASNNLGIDMQKTHQHLIDWFLDSLFEHKSQDSLPLFGWVQMVFPPKQPPEKLFGIHQKFLAKELTTSRPLHKKQAHKLAFLLLSYWYEEVALKRGLFGIIDEVPFSYSELWLHF
jgi:hypothetical protein